MLYCVTCWLMDWLLVFWLEYTTFVVHRENFRSDDINKKHNSHNYKWSDISRMSSCYMWPPGCRRGWPVLLLLSAEEQPKYIFLFQLGTAYWSNSLSLLVLGWGGQTLSLSQSCWPSWCPREPGQYLWPKVENMEIIIAYIIIEYGDNNNQ